MAGKNNDRHSLEALELRDAQLDVVQGGILFFDEADAVRGGKGAGRSVTGLAELSDEQLDKVQGGVDVRIEKIEVTVRTESGSSGLSHHTTGKIVEAVTKAMDGGDANTNADTDQKSNDNK